MIDVGCLFYDRKKAGFRFEQKKKQQLWRIESELSCAQRKSKLTNIWANVNVGVV